MENLNEVWNPHYFFKNGYYYTNMDRKMEMPLCVIHADPTACKSKCQDTGCIFYSPPKIKKIEDKKFVFITIQDFKRRMCDLDKLQKFIKTISYMYESGQWIIETGKNEDSENYNIHIHLLVRIGDHIKDHKKILNIKWTNLFDTDLYDKDYYDISQHRKSKKMPDYEDWLEEKKKYFINDLKGSHKNTEDLGLTGFFE